jgi:hypothetical protein
MVAKNCGLIIHGCIIRRYKPLLDFTLLRPRTESPGTTMTKRIRIPFEGRLFLTAVSNLKCVTLRGKKSLVCSGISAVAHLFHTAC